MSFMSFDYAMRAADAALQFQQSQGQNIKDTNARAREVGTGNAKRKDDLVRQKIEAEYDALSAEIKKDKALRLAELAEEKKKSALLATMLVGAGSFIGGMIDGIVDMAKGDPNAVPDSAQMNVGGSAASDGYAVSMRIAGGTGNSEQGAIVTFDKDQKTFSVVGVNTTTGAPTGFVQVSASDMARQIQNSLGPVPNPPTAESAEHQRLRSMIEEGPPPMFKAEFFNSENGMHEDLRSALFGNNGAPPGFFAEGSRTFAEGTNAGQQAGSDQGEMMIGGMLRTAGPISNAYATTANNLVSLLEVDSIRKGMGASEDIASKTEDSFQSQGIRIGGADRFMHGVGDAFSKCIFKPLGTAINQFMELAKVAKQYDEEAAEKRAEYDAAKKQAALARQKLLKLESLLAAGSSA